MLDAERRTAGPLPQPLSRLLQAVVVLAAAVPALHLLRAIARGSHMQFYDYYQMVGQTFSDGGEFIASGLLVHQNEHLLAVPKLLYWANITAFGGSNVTLGVLVWLVSLATALVIAYGLRAEARSMSRTTRTAMACVVLLYAFPLAAAHNYLYSMSGTAWLLANLFGLCAIVALTRGQPELAGLFGALGTFTYGTGLAIWPALAVLVVLRRRFSRREATMFALGAAAVAVERLTVHAVDHHPALTWNPFDILRSMAVSAGALFAREANSATLVGLLLLGLAAWLIVHHIRGDVPTAGRLTMVGSTTYCLCVLLLFGITRTGFSQGMLMSSRYMAVAALFALSVSVLALLAQPRSPWVGGLAVVVGVASTIVALPALGHVQDVAKRQTISAVAARLGVADGRIRQYTAETGPILRSLDHYPFNERFGFDCGLLGEPVAGIEPYDPGTVAGHLEAIASDEHPSGVDVEGWAYSEHGIDCILLLDPQDVVVGAAVHGFERADVADAIEADRDDLGWIGVADDGSATSLRAVVAVEGMDGFYELDRSDDVHP